MSWFTPRNDETLLAYLAAILTEQRELARKVHAMTLDISHATAALAKLTADVTALLALQNKTQLQVETVSNQLAAAIANGNADAITQAQKDLEAIAVGMDQEAAAIEAVINAPPPATPTGSTGPAAPVTA